MYQETRDNAQAEQPTAAVQPLQLRETNMPNGSESDFEMKLKEFFGADFQLSDEMSQYILLEHLRINREQNEQLANALDRDPRLAQMLSDIVKGERNAHSAMARYFGRSMMDFQEGTPEYEEMLQADDERRDEVFRLANERHEYESNLEKSRPVIEQFCSERGYEPADFFDSVWEQIVQPIMSGNYSKEVCIALDNAINYDIDVEKAFAAGDIKGRNTNIMRMKENFGDGMPKGITSAAPETAPKPKRTNSLIDAALEA